MASAGPVGGLARARRGRSAAAGASRRAPFGLTLAGALVAFAVVLPAVYLLIVVAGDPANSISEALSVANLEVLARTMLLAVAVVASSIALAVPVAWLTVRTDLPGRRAWAALCTLPIVVPTYVGAYLMVAALGPNGILSDLLGVDSVPSIYGFPGAWIVLTLFTFPLILLPVRAALRRTDAQLEDAAHAMGRSSFETFRTVVVPQLWPALAGGSLLVALFVMSDFGAVSILRFDSVTREIYISYKSAFDRSATAGIACMLVLLMVLLLWLATRVRGRASVHRSGPGAIRPPAPRPLGRWKVPALAFCGSLVLVALVIPVAVLIYWSTKGITAGTMSPGLIGALAGNSLLTGLGAAAVGGLAAFVLALLATRWPSATAHAFERMGHAGYALPGIIVALALAYFATRVALPLYQTLALLVFALAVHYLALGIGPIAAALKQVSPRVEEAAATMGRTPSQVFATITVPLVRGGIAAGVALIFLHAIKELPATLILAPIGFETLATEIWNQTSFGFFEASAIPSLVLLLVAAPPLYLLSERGVSSP